MDIESIFYSGLPNSTAHTFETPFEFAIFKSFSSSLNPQALLAMKATFSLLALAVAVTSMAAADSHSPSHALVFQAPLAADADCHALKAEASCLAAHCAWCKAGAVPSACYTSEEAQQLPPAVFQCDTKPSAQSWALTEVRFNSMCETNEPRRHSTSLVLYDRTNQVPEDAAGMRALFSAWRRARGKNYATALEAELRADVFAANARLVAAHNAQDNVSFTMELNDFADLSWCVRVRVAIHPMLALCFLLSPSVYSTGTSSSAGTSEVHRTARRPHGPSRFFLLSEPLVPYTERPPLSLSTTPASPTRSRTTLYQTQRTGARTAPCRP